MKYDIYNLSELFEKINNLLIQYFDEEDRFSFYKKEDKYKNKYDLSRRGYFLYLSNGDKFSIKIDKKHLPHLLGINTNYLKSTGLYKGNAYEVMISFIKSAQSVIENSQRGVIDLKKALSSYADIKAEGLLTNLYINLEQCELVCKYDRTRTYGCSDSFDKMSYLILQKKNDKYYVLKLARSEYNENEHYPMSNQVFDSYEDLLDNLSSYLNNQETTLINGLNIMNCGSQTSSFIIKSTEERMNKLENLKKISKDLKCTPDVLYDYSYSLKLMKNNKSSSEEDNYFITLLSDCISKGKVFDLNRYPVDSTSLLALINAYNNSLFKKSDNNLENETIFSDVLSENKRVKSELEEVKSYNKGLVLKINGLEEENECLKRKYKDSEKIVETIKQLVNKPKNN